MNYSIVIGGEVRQWAIEGILSLILSRMVYNIKNSEASGTDMINKNIRTAKAGYNYAINACTESGVIIPMPAIDRHVLVNDSPGLTYAASILTNQGYE
ncbi:MAG: hypothetical protein HQK97_03570 [Nitrospirae bacterium]|nr:hypothetical protein [Nitrospirota bacterium]